ncbi:MAG: pyridoxamine 5'-phosphate oxidase family protein [Rhodospirillaceae bacterium]|jgi:uncharacterized protein|nr:pyridoxamine 5'-phosphate oxidase family protein [Rhodospirillaceae bacterium]MBT6117170.1 pyridoxamine 5'-phosphate oxidase family protein [Rhodospirillaceae bacterium]
MADETKAFEPTDRTRVRRSHERAAYDRQTVYDILDSGLICHVGYNIDSKPFVTSTAYWREGDRVVWHGSSASRMIRAIEGGIPVCFNLSLWDGFVLARSGFHSSMNYRSVVIYGEAEKIEGWEAKEASLKMFVDRIWPGHWDKLRPINKQEMKATTLLSLPIEEAVAKVRTGPPVDDEEDYDLDVWAGVLPIRQSFGPPEPDPRLKPGIEAPDFLKNFRLDRG